MLRSFISLGQARLPQHVVGITPSIKVRPQPQRSELILPRGDASGSVRQVATGCLASAGRKFSARTQPEKVRLLSKTVLVLRQSSQSGTEVLSGAGGKHRSPLPATSCMPSGPHPTPKSSPCSIPPAFPQTHGSVSPLPTKSLTLIWDGCGDKP